MDKGKLEMDTLPRLRTYEGQIFNLEDGSNVRIDEVSFLKKRADIPTRTVTVTVDNALINGENLNDVTLVTEFGTEYEVRFYLTQIQSGIVSSTDLIHTYAGTTPNFEQAIQELIKDNSDLGMAIEG